MPNICPSCKLSYPKDSPRCLSCGLPPPTKRGFPNVLLTNKRGERKELIRLYDEAIANSESVGTIGKVREFEEVVQTEARLITACMHNKFFPLADRDGAVFPTFQQLFHAELAFAGDDPNNNDRLIAEEATLPGCSKRIHFAVLAISDVGIRHYGNYFLIWNLEMVSHRTSLFIANCLTWHLENKMRLNMPAPPGNRASWEDRGVLAVVKSAASITTRTRPSAFPRLLLRDRRTKREYDVFIEGHIWGPLTRRSLAKVVYTAREISTAKQLQAEEIAEELRKIGVDVEGI
jgi:hypothetical protein